MDLGRLWIHVFPLQKDRESALAVQTSPVPEDRAGSALRLGRGFGGEAGKELEGLVLTWSQACGSIHVYHIE